MSDEKLKEEREEFRQLMDFNPAFPVTRTFDERALFAYGMSLRDYFAGHALVGLLAAETSAECNSAAGNAREAYQLADAMLEARKTNAPPTDP